MNTPTKPSPPSKGAWLKFTEPCPLSLPPEPRPATLPPKTRILVAEDDPVSLQLVCSRLEKYGYDVIAAKDGVEAMMALRKKDAPSLAILDWVMPGMNGPEICRRTREVNRTLYVIMLSALSSREHLVEGLNAGADDYLSKPFDKDELQARILVGLRVMAAQTALADRVKQLEVGGREN